MTARSTHDSPTSRATPAIGVPHTPRRQSTEERRTSREIQRHSPEGRPAHPEFRARDITLLLVGAGLAVVVASIIVTLTVGVWPGLVVLVFGMGLAILLNPEIWASSLRVKERSDIEHAAPRGRDARHTPE